MNQRAFFHTERGPFSQSSGAQNKPHLFSRSHFHDSGKRGFYCTSHMIHSTTDEPPPSPSPHVKFPLGQVVATPGALASMSPEEIAEAIRRHVSGDWGELDPHDIAENELGLREGFRLLSVYRTKAGERFYIITEADRSATTVLLPDEY